MLLHHVMAEVCGIKGAWGYPEGGMGGVTQAMARAATEAGAHLYTSKVEEECLPHCCVSVCPSLCLSLCLNVFWVTVLLSSFGSDVPR